MNVNKNIVNHEKTIEHKTQESQTIQKVQDLQTQIQEIKKRLQQSQMIIFKELNKELKVENIFDQV